MGEFDDFIQLAQEMIAENGQLVNWFPQDVTVPDSTKPWKTASVINPPSFPVSIAFVGDDTTDVKGTSVPSGAFKGLMGAVIGFVPAMNDTVVRVFSGQDVNLKVTSIEIVAPDGNPILYKLGFD